ncbi:MAG: flagellar basal body-associated FliL family protein [Bacillota bacterium]
MADEESGGRSVKLFIALGILMIIIAAATSYGFMTYYAPGQETNGNGGENSKKIGHTYDLGEFVVNLSETSGRQFIKASVVVEVSQKDLVEELDQRSPQVRDIIISILRDQEIEDIEEPGATTIKNMIKTELNRVLNKGEITDVWFTQLVVQ